MRTGNRGQLLSDIRYTDDMGFIRRCPQCAEWYPLTLEFWYRRWLTRCRACVLEWKRGYQNEKYRKDPTFAQMKKDAAKLTAWKQRQWDEEGVKARKRAYYHANREAILAKQRMAYRRKGPPLDLGQD
jgi:hypothetical protein